MKYARLEECRLADLRQMALIHAIEACGPCKHNCDVVHYQASLLATARLFYLFLCGEDEMLTGAMPTKPSGARAHP